LPEAYERDASLRVKARDFSRFNGGRAIAMRSNTLLLLAVEFSRARCNHIHTRQRTKTLRTEGINEALALPLFLRLS